MAAALRLGEAERRHLLALAQKSGRASFEREEVPANIRAMIVCMSQRAWIIGERWDILASNVEAEEFVDFSGTPPAEQNLITWILLDSRARALLGPTWAREAERKVALFRAAYDQWSDDAAFQAIVDRLKQESLEFNAWWQSHEVEEPTSGTKYLIHPRKGRVHIRFALFRAMEASRLKLLLYKII